MIARTGVTMRHVLRRNGTPYDAPGLDAPDLDDQAPLDASTASPIPRNRPIVVTPRGTRRCRPSETVLDIPPSPVTAPTTPRLTNPPP